MADTAGPVCPEFLTSWVRSGEYLSLEPGNVPEHVRLSPPVPGMHLVHTTEDAANTPLATQALLASPLDVVARMVEVPPASVAASLDLAGALARADRLRLPVRLPGSSLAGSNSDWVLPIDEHGRPTDADHAAYVLVLPESHLVAEHTSSGAELDLGRIRSSGPMFGQVRLVPGGIEFGLPSAIVAARYGGSHITGVPTGETRSVQGGVGPLWRELAGLTPGSIIRLNVGEGESRSEYLALSDRDGLSIVQEKPSGLVAAALPRDLSTVTMTAVLAVDAQQRDAVWAAQMLPVLELRAEQAKQRLSQDSPEFQKWDKTLRDYQSAVAKALTEGRLPEQSIVVRMLKARPEQEREWQAWSGKQAEEAFKHGTDRAEQWLNRVLYGEFPLWTGALGRTPDALRNEDYLPLVRTVFGPRAEAVSDRHLTVLREHVKALLDAGAEVTRAALVRREQFAVLRLELDGNAATSTTVDSQANSDSPAVGEAEGTPLQSLNKDGTAISPDRGEAARAADRKLEIRGLLRELPPGMAFVRVPANEAVLDHAIDLAYRRYAKQNGGHPLDRPVRWSDLDQLLGDGTPLTWRRLETVAAEAQSRQQWRDRKRVTTWSRRQVRTNIVRIPGVQRSVHYQSVLERQRRRDLKKPAQLDSPTARLEEAKLLSWTAYQGRTPETSVASAAPVSAQAQTSTTTPAPLTLADFERLVGVRRKFFTGRGDRRFTDLSSYRPMALELLGSNRTVGAAELIEMAQLVRDAEAELANSLTNPRSLIDRRSLREVLAASVVAKWHDTNPLTRPTPPGMASDVDHSRLVSAFHAIGELPFVPELTNWLNGIIPEADHAVAPIEVRRKLMSLFGQGLDDGLNIPVESKRYDLRLWPVPVAPPKVEAGSLLGAKEEGSTRRSAKMENRAYRYRDLAMSQTSTRGFSWDVGPAYRAEVGVPDTVASTRFDIYASYGQSNTRDQRPLEATAISDYQQLRIKEPVGDVLLPVTWVARVEDRRTGRWKEFFFEKPAGGLRQDTVTYAVAQFQLPYSAAESKSQKGTDPDYLREIRITSAEQFPLWRMDFAVSRVQVADQVLAGLRSNLSAQDYVFWKPVVEAYLTNDQLMMGLKNILRPRNEQNYQQVFRQTLERDGRHLSFSLTSGDRDQPIDKIMKISEVSRSGETRFDWVLAIVRKTLNSVNRARGHRGTVAPGLRLLKRVLRLGGSGRYTWRRALQEIRHHRAWLTRAQRVVGTLQYLLADFTAQLEVEHRGGDGQVGDGSITINGYAHLLMHSADLRSLAQPSKLNPKPLQWSKSTVPAHQEADAAEDAQLVKDAAPDSTKSWWTLSGFGITMDFVERLHGVPQLYNSIVPPLVNAGYLPTAAMGVGVQPWEHLKTLARTGADTNLPGQEYTNWRMLLNQLSEDTLRTLSDDVLGAEAGQPGVALVFPHPDHPEVQEQRLTVGLWAEIAGDSTHQGVTKYQIQYGHTSVDTMTVKRATGSSGDLSGYAAVDLLPEEINVLGQYGRQGSASSTDKLGRTQSTALTSDTDGQKMPSSRYQLPIRWRWFAELGDMRLKSGKVSATMTLLQPDALHDKKGEARLLPLLPVEVASSVLARMGAAVYTAMGTKGVGELQRRLIQAAVPGLPKAAIWQGLSTIVYKTALMRALSGAATIPIGGQQIGLATQPVGRPQIVKVWFPYTQQIVESQVGHEQGSDRLRQRGWQLGGGGRSDHISGDMSITKSKGKGEGSASLFTVGSYRAIYQDTKMVIVRTAVINWVATADGTMISSPGEILVNVLLSDVVAHRHEFDNDRLLNEHVTGTAPALSRALTTKLDPPVALQDGNSWSAVWPVMFNGGNAQFGAGALMTKLVRAAREVGGPELVVQVMSLPGGLGPYMARLLDGGASWTYSVGTRRFELVLTAELIGPARDSRPGATGGKLYERGNKARDASRRNVSSSAITSSVLGIGGPVSASASVTGTERIDQADSRGSNLLFMEGLRANKLTDFTQAVRYQGYIREIRGTADKATDKVKSWTGHARTMSQDFKVESEHLVGVPTEGTVPRGLPTRTFGFQLTNGKLPDTYRIIGIKGLQPIYAALAGTELVRYHDPATVTPLSEEGEHGTVEPLTFESRRTMLPGMLAGGAPLRWVVTASGALEARGGNLTVRARFGELRQIYFMEKAELENYDHGTDLAAHNRNHNVQKSASGWLTLVFPVAPGQYVGPRFAGSKESGKTIGIDQTNWIEHRAWLRNDTSVYFVYSTLEYEIEAPNGTVVRTTGGVELVVDKAGALQLGIGLDVLKSVVPEKQRAKEFGTDGSSSIAPLTRATQTTLLPSVAEELGPRYDKLLAALGQASDQHLATAKVPATSPVAPPMKWHDVPDDGDCLFHAVVDSARRQGIALPPGVTDMPSLRGWATAEMAKRPGQFADILGRTTGRLVADELKARLRASGTTDPRPYLDFRPSPPSAEKRAEWQKTAENDAVYEEAKRRGLPIADLSPAVLRTMMRDWQPPNLDDAVRQLEQNDAIAQTWSEIARRIDAGDRAAHDRLKGLTGAGPLIDAVRNSLNSTNTVPTPEQLLTQAMASSALWNTAIGDDVPAALARLVNLNIVVVDQDFAAPLNPTAQKTLYVRRINRNHYQSGAPESTVQQMDTGQESDVTPPTWQLRLDDTVAAQDNVYVVSSHAKSEPTQLIADLRAGANADRPIIVLGVEKTGRSPLSADVAQVNVLLEQFAQRGQLAVVVTRGQVSGDLRDMLGRYGAAVVHQTLKKPGGAGLSGLGGLNSSLGNNWTITGSSLDQGTSSTSDVWDRVTPAVLDAAMKLARPTAAVSRVDDGLGELIWAANLGVAWQAFQRLDWSPDQMRSHLASVSEMVKRVPNQPALAVFEPVLEFGAVGQSDIVFEYATSEVAERPKALLASVGKLENAGKLGGGLTTDHLAAMVVATGASDNDISVPVLAVIGDIRAGKFSSAKQFIDDNRGKLTTEEKGQWVDAITGLRADMPGHDNALQMLSEAVLNC
ncbi:hypothetical protein ACWDV4_24820 [Micromonospora sp. NPDC003197]